MTMQVNSWMIDSFLGQSAVRKYHTPVGLQTVNSAAVGSGGWEAEMGGQQGSSEFSVLRL